MLPGTVISLRSWMLSALLHGAVFGVAGWGILRPHDQPPVVAVQESPVTGTIVSLELNPDPEPTSREMTATTVSPADDGGDSWEEFCREDTPPDPWTKEALPLVSLPAMPQRASAPAPVPLTSKSGNCVRSRPRASVPRTGAVDSRPDYLHNPPPVYPEASRLAGEEGVVLVRVEISSRGSVLGRTLVKSSGYSDLDREALRAVSGWKFRPAVLGGFPMAASVTVPLRFEIHTKAS